jgi:hypothetical protein
MGLAQLEGYWNKPTLFLLRLKKKNDLRNKSILNPKTSLRDCENQRCGGTSSMKLGMWELQDFTGFIINSLL